MWQGEKICFSRTRKKLYGDIRKNWVSLSVNIHMVLRKFLYSFFNED